MNAPTTPTARLARVVPTEPALAATGLVAVLLAPLLTRSGSLWLLLDVVGGLVAVAAARTAVRRHWAAGPVGLGQLADAAGILAISAALLLVGAKGPLNRLPSVAIMILSAFGAVLAVLVVGTASAGLLRDRPSGAPRPADGRGAALLTVGLALAAVVVAVLDATRR